MNARLGCAFMWIYPKFEHFLNDSVESSVSYREESEEQALPYALPFNDFITAVRAVHGSTLIRPAQAQGAFAGVEDKWQ